MQNYTKFNKFWKMGIRRKWSGIVCGILIVLVYYSTYRGCSLILTRVDICNINQFVTSP